MRIPMRRRQRIGINVYKFLHQTREQLDLNINYPYRSTINVISIYNINSLM